MEGYDFSGSGSNAATLASRAGEGDFSVGGGLKFPGWFWPVAIVLAGLGLFLWLND